MKEKIEQRIGALEQNIANTVAYRDAFTCDDDEIEIYNEEIRILELRIAELQWVLKNMT